MSRRPWGFSGRRGGLKKFVRRQLNFYRLLYLPYQSAYNHIVTMEYEGLDAKSAAARRVKGAEVWRLLSPIFQIKVVVGKQHDQ